MGGLSVVVLAGFCFWVCEMNLNYRTLIGRFLLLVCLELFPYDRKKAS